MNGTTLRDRGVEMVSRNTDPKWVEDCDITIRCMALSGEEFSAEDVRSMAGDPPTPNAMGARFLQASRQGIIRRVGYRQATRPDAHARVLAVYIGGSR
jgi:hypothetical protein